MLTNSINTSKPTVAGFIRIFFSRTMFINNVYPLPALINTQYCYLIMCHNLHLRLYIFSVFSLSLFLQFFSYSYHLVFVSTSLSFWLLDSCLLHFPARFIVPNNVYTDTMPYTPVTPLCVAHYNVLDLIYIPLLTVRIQ